MATIREIPPWGDQRTARELFGICKENLRRLEAEGIIRAKKLGPGNKAQKLYRLADVAAYLEG